MKASDPADLVRERLGAAIFQRVAGPQGPQRRRLIGAPGERWFAEDRPIRAVHGDSSMFIGGITALLLQSLHPLAMAAANRSPRAALPGASTSPARDTGASLTLPGDQRPTYHSQAGEQVPASRYTSDRAPGARPDLLL